MTWPEALLDPPFYDSQEEYEMERVTNEQIYREVREIRTVLLGVPESEDMGLYGKVRDLKKLQKEMNGTVKNDHSEIVRNSTSLRYMKYMIYMLAIAVISAVTTGIMGVW